MTMANYVKSSAFTGLGLVLAIGNGASPEVYTTIGEVKTSAGPQLKNDTVDVTNVQSPGGVKEFLASLTDPGEVSVTVNYVPGDPGQQAFYAALIAKSRVPFQLTLPPSSVETSGDIAGYWDFLGIPTEYSIDIPLDKEATLALKIKVSGLPTFTPETV